MPRFSKVRATCMDGNSGTVTSRTGSTFGNRGSSAFDTSNAVGSGGSSGNNNGLGPYGIGTGVGMGFGLYRPRRPSYTLATQACRQRTESYRYATRRDHPDMGTDVDVLDGEDFIDGVIKRSSRQASLIREASGSKENDDDEGEEMVAVQGLPHGDDYDNDNDDDDSDDNAIVTTAAAAAVSRAMTPECRVAQVDVVVTDEESDSRATSTFYLPQSSCSDQFLLEPTKQQVPTVESNCLNRNVPNHLSLYNPNYQSGLQQNGPDNNALNAPHAVVVNNGNGTTPSIGPGKILPDLRNSHSSHNDLAHSIPFPPPPPPEAISRKRKPLRRSFACGEPENDEVFRETSALPTVSVSITTPNTTTTATTPDSNGSNNCETETVIVGLLTPVNGRPNNIKNVKNGNNKGNSTTYPNRRQNSNVSHKKYFRPGMSPFSFTKNLIVLCLGFIFVYSSFRAIQNLQSSVNGDQDLGVITMTIVHISMVFASLLAPIIINIFTAKWAMCAGVACFIAWFGAHIHPTFWTLVPTSVLVGLGQAVIWNAESSYVLKLAYDSATAHGGVGNLDQEMFRFHGIFLACFQSTHIWGNLISSLMLSWYKNQLLKARGRQAPPIMIPVGDGAVMMDNAGNLGNSLIDSSGNASFSQDDFVQGGGDEEYGEIIIGVYCGTLHRCTPGQDQLLPDIYPEVYSLSPMLWKLMTSYIVLGCISFGLVLMFLDRIGARADPDRTPKQIIVQHINQLFHHKTLRLLTPLLLFNGMQQGFIFSDYNRYFVTCALGVNYVGYCMITLGASNVLGTIFVAFFSHKIPREVVLGFGGILHISLMIGFLIWIPDKSPILYFVLAAAWGLCDAVWQTQCNTLICLTCSDAPEVAFNNYRLVQSLGLALTFGSEPMMCLPARMYLLLTLLVIAIMFYVLAEYRIRNGDGEDT